VAFVGPDGAGKSTVTAVIAAELGARVVYLGVNLDEDPIALPTTRLLRALRRQRTADAVERPVAGPGRLTPAGARGLSSRGVGGWAYWINLILEEWYRALLVAHHVRRGRTVLLDRHVVADYYPWDDGGTVLRRLHGFLLRSWYPRPDLVVVLDAPAELLHRRKGEDAIPELDRRRRHYLEAAASMPRHTVVDASQSLDVVTAAVREAVAR
jgi:thymidylate kinase